MGIDLTRHVTVFVTTEPPPRLKRRLVRWGIERATSFRRRWRIETGFRDCNRFFPTTRARTNAAKKLALALRMFAYNAWQVQWARRRELRRVPKKWRAGPTLRRFCRVQVEVHLCDVSSGPAGLKREVGLHFHRKLNFFLQG